MFGKKCTKCNIEIGGLFGIRNSGTKERPLCQKCDSKEQEERCVLEKEKLEKERIEKEKQDKERREKEQREKEFREVYNKELTSEVKYKLSESTMILLDKGISIIESSIQLKPGFTSISGAGSEGGLIEASKYFETACNEATNYPILRYAYCSVLHAAMQFKTAQNEMEELIRRHPNYSLAKCALANWDKWKPVFNLPPWTIDIQSVHDTIAREVISCVLLPVRDKYIPRAALFFKDQNGDLNVEALQSAKIDITAIFDSALRIPIFGILSRIWDDPKNSLNIEAHSLPLGMHGNNFRLACEYITRQVDIDFVVLSRSNKILLNRRIPMPERMMDSVYKLATYLMGKNDEGHDYSGNEIYQAMKPFQDRYEATTVAY